MPLSKVSPGDAIKSEQYNNVVEECSSLKESITGLDETIGTMEETVDGVKRAVTEISVIDDNGWSLLLTHADQTTSTVPLQSLIDAIVALAKA